ncbi:hypothetical protein ES703_38125 [subsurface metagenome]
MLTLIDGPCEGTYMCWRAPTFLRATINATGEIDCLDQVEDTPAESEKVYVYKVQGSVGSVHLHAKGCTGWYALARYCHLPDVNGEGLRDNDVWQAWATKHFNPENEQ